MSKSFIIFAGYKNNNNITLHFCINKQKEKSNPLTKLPYIYIRTYLISLCRVSLLKIQFYINNLSFFIIPYHFYHLFTFYNRILFIIIIIFFLILSKNTCDIECENEKRYKKKNYVVKFLIIIIINIYKIVQFAAPVNIMENG